MEAIEVTRLLHGSMLTSHLRATHDAAVECVETDVAFTPVCAESQRTKRERHKNCPLRNFAVERGFMGMLTEDTSKCRCVNKARGPLVVHLATRILASFWRVINCASIMNLSKKYGSTLCISRCAVRKTP